MCGHICCITNASSALQGNCFVWWVFNPRADFSSYPYLSAVSVSPVLSMSGLQVSKTGKGWCRSIIMRGSSKFETSLWILERLVRRSLWSCPPGCRKAVTSTGWGWLEHVWRALQTSKDGDLTTQCLNALLSFELIRMRKQSTAALANGFWTPVSCWSSI